MAQQTQTVAANTNQAEGREKLYTHAGIVSSREFLKPSTGTPYVKTAYTQKGTDGKVTQLTLMAFGKARRGRRRRGQPPVIAALV